MRRFVLGLCVLLPFRGAAAADIPLVHFTDAVRDHPIDAGRGASFDEVARGAESSINLWQITTQMPAHFHKSHEEVIVVESGTGEARIGDRTIAMKAGDVLLIPAGTVHSARVVGSEPFRGISVFAPAFDAQDRVPVAPQPAAGTEAPGPP
jgi:quercetin dioxygenase-like cupin family protein